jgi:hydroxyethylthiazole kinase-like uncharacterized protein yjeF
MSFSISTTTTSSELKYLTQKEAQEIDNELMNEQGFSLEQLMELAGLSVASAIFHAFPPRTHPNAFVVCGPGNNGGDGLVASRHLSHFGYSPVIFYPKQTPKQLFQNLVTQCKCLDIPFVDDIPEYLDKKFDLIVDGIFGFSFSGSIRPPFDIILKKLNASKLPIASIDVPSGWDVEKGNITNEGLRATMLVSLTAPKLCAELFTGPFHYLGGRFIPRSLDRKYKLNIPPYPNTESFVILRSQL